MAMSRARPFTGMALDRASTERKDPKRVEQLRRDPDARTLIAAEDGVLLSDGPTPALARVELAAESGPPPILLGLDDAGKPVFGIDLEAAPADLRAQLMEDAKLTPLREAGVLLAHDEAGLAAYLSSLIGWHRRHEFCANCGAATRIEEAGYSRRCPRCGATHFPRTDPVVIMTVEHDGRLLLGRRAGWPPGRCSVLAGFISPGESAEEAVVREVQEESGIVVRDPQFVASQPWPFPSSLMLGFDAFSDGGEPHARDGELAEVQWFGLDEVRTAAAEQNPKLRLPPPVSIARFLIDRWLARHEA
jgi:NAD+ diphosphatase